MLILTIQNNIKKVFFGLVLSCIVVLLDTTFLPLLK